MSVSTDDRFAELLLSIDTRLLMYGTRLTAIETLLTRIATALELKPLHNAETSEPEHAVPDSEPAPRMRRRPTHAQVERDNAVLDALEDGPLTLTALARKVYRTDRLTDRETTSLYPVLQRLMRDGYVTCDERKRYALRRKPAVVGEREEMSV